MPLAVDSGVFVDALRFVGENPRLILDKTGEHLVLSGATIAVAVAIALPIGIGSSSPSGSSGTSYHVHTLVSVGP